MKLLCLPDIHATDSRPVNRTDNYWDTVKQKLNFIFDTAEKEQVDAILSPGDLTDSPSLSNLELRELVGLFKRRSKEFFTTYGQHDLRYRTRPQSALLLLEEAISPEKFHVMDKSSSIDFERKNITINASAYGESIPDPIEDHFNILLIHRMIIEEKLWSKQEEYEPANVFLRQNNYDLIVSGDNHSGFLASTKGGRVLINCGSMMRSTIAQIDHKPFVVLFDTETKKYKQIFIPIEPSEKVFRIEKVEIEKERNESLESFVAGLSQQKEIGLLFEDNLNQFAKENSIEPEVMEIIYASFR
jgi:exonuclease SbcD